MSTSNISFTKRKAHVIHLTGSLKPEEDRMNETSITEVVKAGDKVQVNDAVQNFCYDNNLVQQGTNLGYAEIESIEEDGSVKLKGVDGIKFNIATNCKTL